MEYFFTKHILFFIGALIFSFFINNILLRFIKTLGIRDDKETIIRWSEQAKPAIGGLTFYIIFLLSITLHPFIFSYQSEIINFKATGIIGAVSLGFLMGLADDAYNTKPLLKLITQIICGGLLIYSGTYIQLFDSTILNYALTIFWVVGLMNSINMLDNMDGITSAVSLIITLTILSVMITINELTEISFTIVIGLIATLFGFLYFNWNPAKMYMGDTGSQFLGILLAALSINYLWNPVANEEFSTSRQFIIPILTFTIPIIDTITVSIKRISKGKSPFVGGKDHTTHHLSYLGISERNVAIIMILISIISSIIVFCILNYIHHWTHFYTFIFSIYFLTVFVILFRIALKNTDKQ